MKWLLKWMLKRRGPIQTGYLTCNQCGGGKWRVAMIHDGDVNQFGRTYGCWAICIADSDKGQGGCGNVMAFEHFTPAFRAYNPETTEAWRKG